MRHGIRRMPWLAAVIAVVAMASPALAAPPPAAKQSESFEKCAADYAALQKLFGAIGQKSSAIDQRNKQLADMYIQLNQKRTAMGSDAAAQADYKKLFDRYQTQSKDLTDNLAPDLQKTQASYASQNAAYEKSCVAADDVPTPKPKGKP